LVSAPAAATNDPASAPQPAPKPTAPSLAQSNKSTSPEPPKARSDKPSSSTRAEKDVLATSQEKVEETGSGKGKQKEDTKRKASHEGEGSRTQRKKKKLERKWELEVVSQLRRSWWLRWRAATDPSLRPLQTKKHDVVFGNNATISYTPLSKLDRTKGDNTPVNVIAVASVHNAPRKAERGNKGKFAL
jgi:hypothetical protein